MEVNSITELYELIIKKENMLEIRSKLHEFCDNIDFDSLLKDYSDSEQVTMMIMRIKAEYTKMINSEKTIYKISLEQLKKRIAKLKQVDEIYQSSSNPYIRFDMMLKLFKKPSIFYKSYTQLILLGKEDQLLDEIRPLLQNFDYYYNDFKKSYNGEVHKAVLDAYKNNNDYNQFMYAKFILQEYLNSEDSYLMDSFLNRYNIDLDAFNYFLKIIKFRQKSLYDKYLVKKQENDFKARDYYKHMYDDLAYAIKNGEFVYGNKFDLLEFIKYLPFKISNSFMEETTAFLTNNNPLIKDIIIDYIKENDLTSNNVFKRLNNDSLYQATIILNGQTINNPHDINLIINYLQSREIPICKATLKKACEMYLNNEINCSYISDSRFVKKREPVIVPNCK